jgi:hypothetical protein
LRNAAIVLGILLVLILASLVIAPRLVDIDRFKGTLSAQLARRTGRAVEIRGRLSLSLLPAPGLMARDVRLANPPGAAVQDMVRLRALDVKLALLPLLGGRVEVRRADLIEPEIDLERLPNGMPNWRFLRPSANATGALSTDGRVSQPFAIEGITLQNAAVTYRSGSGAERFEHINAEIGIDPENGSISAKGKLVARGAELSFDLRSGAPAAAEVPVQLTVAARPTARLQLDGVLSGPVGDRRIDGQLKLTADDARAALATLAQRQLPMELAQRLSVAGRLKGTRHALALQNLEVDFGPMHGEGRLHADSGKSLDLALTLGIGQLDLDHWPKALGRASWEMPSLVASAFAAAPTPAATAPADGAAAAFRPPRTSWHRALLEDLHLPRL